MSFTYHIISPFTMTLNADSLNSAIKSYVQLNRNNNISQLIIKDKQNHYKAQLKYFKKNNRNKVGINIFPLAPGYLPSLSPSPNPASPVIYSSYSPVYPYVPSIRIEDHSS